MGSLEKIFTLKPALYLVPTPIGNIDDITVRGLKTLRTADIICCEDTRETGKLLKLYGIAPRRMLSVHEHNEARQVEIILNEIISGKSVVLVSDAGSPLMSDPGARLVQAVIASGREVIALPGATAFVPALSASGFDCSEFIFAGFPPQKKGRISFLQRMTDLSITCVIYESPHRLQSLLQSLIELGVNERKCCIARELTKIHEEVLRGSIGEIADHFSKTAPRGEFVIILQGKNAK